MNRLDEYKVSDYVCLSSSILLSVNGMYVPLASGYFIRIAQIAHDGITFRTPFPKRL